MEVLMLENKHIKTFASLCAAVAIGFGAIGTAQGAAREEIAGNWGNEWLGTYLHAG